MKVALHSVEYSGTWGGETVLSIEDFAKKAARLGLTALSLWQRDLTSSPSTKTIRA